MPPKAGIRMFFGGKAAPSEKALKRPLDLDSGSQKFESPVAVESPGKKNKAGGASPKKAAAAAAPKSNFESSQPKPKKKRKDAGMPKRKDSTVVSTGGEASETADGVGTEDEEAPPVGAVDHPKKSGAFAIPAGTVPDIGAVVQAKVKDKWYSALLVKHERFGITQLYAVKGLTVVFDRDVPKPKATYDMGSPDILLTGDMRTVRYWSSGTPCMRATNVDAFAVPTAEAQAAAAQAKVKRHNGR
jgi:hypothetical protein